MQHIAYSALDFKNAAPNEASAKRGRPALRWNFLGLGAELHCRGQQPVAQFISELADLAPDLAHEIQLRLEAYTRIPTEVYQALGADRFTPFMISIDGGRK